MKRFLLPLLLVLLISCSDNDNPAAPSLTANTVTFRVNADEWDITDPIAAIERDIPQLNQNIADRGAVIVYKRSVDDDVWTLWDVSITNLEAGYSYVYFRSYSTGNIVIAVLKSGNADFPGVIKDDNIFKVILLDNRNAPIELSVDKLKNYDYLKQKLDLSD